MTLQATNNATGLLELEDGRSPSESPAFRKPPRSGPEVLPARTTQLPLPYMVGAQGSAANDLDSPTNGSISLAPENRPSSISRTCQASRRGLPRSRDVWRELATVWPNPNDRLRVLVLLISAGECGLLPTVVARDYRSPGDPNHPRQLATRGQPLPEVLGLRLPADFARWMMGFPSEWAQCMPTGTQSTRGSRRRS